MTPAGINAMVAKHVMAWSVYTFNKGDVMTEHDAYRDAAGAWTGFYPSSFQPSEKIEHAWLVVEKMAATGVVFELGLQGPGPVSARFIGQRPTIWLTAGSAPTAICLAALKAVGHSV